MSILIDIPMPNTCGECPCYNSEYDWCNAANHEIEVPHEKMEWCPLKEAN